MSESLGRSIERFIRTGEGDFEALAMELFAYQYDKNKPYQAFCRAQEKTSETVKKWSDIPAVPIAAFKSAELVTFPINHAAAEFHSSGTTQKTPSRHYLKTLTPYETSLSAGFAQWVLPDQAVLPFLILAPSPGEAPRSSLTWMLDVAKRRWGAAGSDYFIQRGRVDDWRLFRALAEHQAAGRPIALLGTTLAFLTLFDQCARQKKTFSCATGSRMMDTGGMKTETRDISREEFLRLAWTYLSIPEASCINEYGMCEMSSQFYARGASPVFQGPAWVRTVVINPETGEPAASGKTGVLRHFDLANIDSVMAIQTEDLGEIQGDGFLLKGRASQADLKGCSIDLERYLKSS
jgi:hypothetical protein